MLRITLTSVSQILVTVILAICLSGVAQASHSLAKVQFSVINNRPGLTQNSITDILQDTEGFIWVTTLGGLHKYDGHQFKRVSLSSGVDDPQWLFRLFEDSSGLLWVGGGQGNVYKINKTTGMVDDLTLAINPNALKVTPGSQPETFGGSIQSFYEDLSGRIWIGSANGLAIYDKHHDTFKVNPQFTFPDGNNIERFSGVRSIVTAAQQRVWMASREGLLLLDPKTNTVVKIYRHQPDDPSSLSSDRLSKILVQDSNIWIGTTDNGINRLDTNTDKIHHYRAIPTDPETLGSNIVLDIMIDSQQRLWVATQSGGLQLYLPDHDSFKRFNKNKNDRFGIPSNDVWSLFEDRSGVLWIGTSGGGIAQVVPSTKKFDVIESIPYNENSLSDGFTWDLAFDASGLLWAATRDGLNSYDPRSQQVKTYRPHGLVDGAFHNNQVISVTHTGRNSLWVGLATGELFDFDLDSHQFNPLVQPSFGNKFSTVRIWTLYLDAWQHMWIATNEGTYRLSPQQQLDLIGGKTDFDVVTQRIARVIYEDNFGRYWLGLNSSGLLVLGEDMSLLKHLVHDPLIKSSISHNTVRSIAQDNEGNLWMGTHGGLNKMLPGDNGQLGDKFQRYFMADGLPDNTIYSILTEGDYLWLATNFGLCKFNNQTGEMQNYDINDGLPANEFNGGAAIKSKGGVLYLGGVNGITHFKSARIIKNTVAPQVAVSRFLVNNQPQGNPFTLSNLGEVELDHQQNNLTFDFAALDYHHPQQNQTRYRLVPHQPQWEQSNSGTIKYANLSPGSYRFEVQGSNNDDVWSAHSAVIDITISPPWWRHPLAWFIYVIFSLYVFYSYRQRGLKKKYQLEEMVLKRTEDLATANQDLAQSNNELEQATEIAEHANELKSSFLANMSHEIRTPLTAIIGFTEHALDPQTDIVERNGYLHRVRRSGQHLLRLINEILDLSKIEAEKLELEDNPINLFELLGDIESFGLALAQEKGLQFKVLYNYPLPLMFNGDLFRIRQVLYNLCGNAIKFTTQGNVSILVNYLPKNNQLHFSIQDTGIGMTAEELKLLFQPFVQADSSITRKYGGSGLGLVISQKLMQLMGGELTVESTKGRGSHFDIFVHSNIENPKLVEQLPHPIGKEPAGKAEAMKQYLDAQVLVAEDNPDNQVLIELLLKPLGINYTIVENGVLAVESAILTAYDLILMDIQMPEMSGTEAVSLMRNAGIDCPIIALTANIMKEDIKSYLACGFDGTLAKPIQKPLFYEALNQYLKKDLSSDLSSDLAQNPQSIDALIEQLHSGDAFNQLKTRFTSHLPDMAKDMEDSLNASNWSNLKQQAHSIKGSAGSMGYPELTKQAAQIEQLIIHENYQSADVATRLFIETCLSIQIEFN